MSTWSSPGARLPDSEVSPSLWDHMVWFLISAPPPTGILDKLLSPSEPWGLCTIPATSPDLWEFCDRKGSKALAPGSPQLMAAAILLLLFLQHHFPDKCVKVGQSPPPQVAFLPSVTVTWRYAITNFIPAEGIKFTLWPNPS